VQQQGWLPSLLGCCPDCWAAKRELGQHWQQLLVGLQLLVLLLVWAGYHPEAHNPAH
jgi:hypothetical protein